MAAGDLDPGRHGRLRGGSAQPRSPDATFGTAGRASVDFGPAASANAVARQPNGRIVVVGRRTGADDFAVARLLA